MNGAWGPSATQFVLAAKPRTSGQKKLGSGAEDAIDGLLVGLAGQIKARRDSEERGQRGHMTTGEGNMLVNLLGASPRERKKGPKNVRSRRQCLPQEGR